MKGETIVQIAILGGVAIGGYFLVSRIGQGLGAVPAAAGEFAEAVQQQAAGVAQGAAEAAEAVGSTVEGAVGAIGGALTGGAAAIPEAAATAGDAAARATGGALGTIDNALRAISGGLSITEQAAISGIPGVQDYALGTLTSQVHSLFQPNNPINVWTDEEVQNRLTTTIKATQGGQYTTIATGQATRFGGYGSAVAQEASLQSAIDESREKYPEYF